MIQDALVWCLVAVAAIAVVAAVALAARNRALGAKKKQTEAELRRQLHISDNHLHVSRAELHRFRSEQDGTLREAKEAAEENTKAVLKGAASFLQSLAAEQTTLLDGVQRKYGGHAVLSDLLEVNHANAQMARKAQGIAVMCGAPLGRRNRPASVYDVVRSAQGQIRNFHRIAIMQQAGLALKASAVAPVALAVAELLDNAASFSQQDAPIEVTFQRVRNNLCIVIDDAGVSMNDEDRQRATELLSGDIVPRLSQLGNQPKFGFPVVGLIARQYGFKVDVTGVSRYGGVRAVVLLPEELWTMEETPPAPEAAVSSILRNEGRPQGAPTRTTHGLPKRGSRQAPIASVPEPEADRPASWAPAENSRPSGRGLGAFQRGTLSGRNLEATSPEGSEDA
ncbi:sensor histidine kinase [Streptomyces sp. NBC_01260]|uniref:ATP-binding protein n=1 Tax=unclassified Streptomyces TaxID=2593676 RepID=UPI000F49EA30|nr:MULTISPECIES: ATP-binding protein [unclassified Streptomyces]MCX4769207.1 sensor histidine kinase [Streptomyces sp. NBC_01285]ROQ76649.1 signal transduction histidine kinase [Streptomyces sp. CEV 2-1]RPK41520.1 Histidine kinase-, DNA gyrase B-, and HSP90-like ATPase [Streptomyces sp. ADI92-24]